MAEAQASHPNGNSGQPERRPAPDVFLDDRGRIHMGPVADDAALPDLAASLCAAAGPLLMTEATVVAAHALSRDRSPMGMVMLRAEGADGSQFRSGTGRGATDAEAVVDAVLDALGAKDGVLAATVDHWASRPEAGAVTVVHVNDVTASTGSPEDTATHIRLTHALPAPGRLAVATEDTEYRVLRLPAAVLAFSSRPGAAVLAELDEWMEVVEQHRAAAPRVGERG